MTLHRLAPRILLVACLVLAQQYAAAHRLMHATEPTLDLQRSASCDECTALAALDAPAGNRAAAMRAPHAAPAEPAPGFVPAAPSQGAPCAHRCRAPPTTV
jgi:hypothetical protein